MRLLKFDCLLGKAVFWEISNRFPRSIATIKFESSFTSVYSSGNPNLLFEMCGFEVRILPKSRAEYEDDLELIEGSWRLINRKSKRITAIAFLKVSVEF